MINKDSLKQAVESLGGHTFASIIATSDPRMKKTGNPLNGREVLKVTKAVVLIGNDYEKMVINRSAKVNGVVPDFEAEGMSGMVWDKKYPRLIAESVKNSEQKYLRVFFNAKTKPETSFTIDGKPATEEEVKVIKSFLPAQSESAKQADEAELEGEDQIRPRSYKEQGILSLKFSNTEFVK